MDLQRLKTNAGITESVNRPADLIFLNELTNQSDLYTFDRNESGGIDVFRLQDGALIGLFTSIDEIIMKALGHSR